jgi:hypothetical protein
MLPAPPARHDAAQPSMIEDRHQAARESSSCVIDGENGVIGSKGAGSSLDGIPKDLARPAEGTRRER